MDKVATVGAHIFYRWRGGMEGALAFRQRYSGSEPSLTGRTTPPGDDVAYAGEEAVGSVVIHRGVLPSATVAVNGGGQACAGCATSGAKLIRVGGGGRGVRVYRGMTGPTSGEDLSDKAVID